MSGITGWYGLEHADARALLIHMAEPLARFDHSRVELQTGNQSAIALANLDDEGSLAHVGHWRIAVHGRPRFNDDQLHARAQAVGLATAFAEAYVQHGIDVLKKLTGPFSLAAVNEVENETLLAVDRLGIYTLSYTFAQQGLVFGSSLDSIRRHPRVTSTLSHQALFDYVYFHMIPAPGTIYENHKRLLPAEYLRLRQGRLDTDCYWKLQFEEQLKQPFAELKQEFRATLREAVFESAQGAGKVGAFLSGGTDSSTLAGVLGEVSGAPAQTYSIGFEAEGYDEMAYARIASKHFATNHHEYYVTPRDIADGIPRMAEIYDQPFGNSSALPTYYCAKFAKADGITRLLGGDGGDELFGGNERYAKQRIFALYELLPETLRTGMIESGLRFPGLQKISLARKAASYVQQANIAMPARLETYNLLNRFGHEKVFTHEFLSGVATQHPIDDLKTVYDSVQAGTMLNRMLALDIKFTLADNDLPKVNKMCELAGVQIAYPMLASSMVDFSSRLAPGLKLKGTKLRWFFKEALRDFLPNEILTKQKHGFGLPFGPWVATHAPLKAVVVDSLQALKKRHIVRPEFIDELTSVHLAEHAGYYGTMIWVLMMLEQWLAHHHPSA